MRVLALEPYFGGSHRAFLEQWQASSRHDWTILGLPPRKWKWRMRHAAVTLSDDVARLLANGAGFDLVFCSDMLNLAEFQGLAPRSVRDLPAVVYFHENQLTYPFRFQGERDLHFGFANMTTALAADSVWFNSAFHRDSFLAALHQALRKMPDYRLPDVVERILRKSRIEPLGVQHITPRTRRQPGPLRLLWVARWEYDKGPEMFFEALRLLRDRGVAFRISVIGEQYAEQPAVFEQAHQTFADVIDRWGYQPTRADYEAALREADVVVSTAEHEFFGVSIVEAIMAGAYPLLPRRLAYPEILREDVVGDASAYFYDGDVESLAGRLAELGNALAAGDIWRGDQGHVRRAAERFDWNRRAPLMDDALEQVRTAG